MLTVRTILIPIDFSDPSAAAARHAVGLASHFDAKLLFAHIVEPAPTEYHAFALGVQPGTTDDYVAELTGKLQEMTRQFGAGFSSETVVIPGDPARRLAALAGDHDADLIVMPTHGYGPFRRFLLGSVTAKVLHDVACPVFTGAHLADRPPFRNGGYQNVICAVGLRENEHSEKLVRWAWDFTQSWRARLHLVHVPSAVEWGAGEWFPPETEQLVRQAARERLGELVEKVGCEAELHIDGLDAARYVAETVEAVDGDVLLVGRTVEHGPFSGANAYRLIRESPCPVISV